MDATDPTKGRNVIREFRKLFLQPQLQCGGIANGDWIPREGVLHTQRPDQAETQLSKFTELRVNARASAGQGVTVNSGFAINYRGKAPGSVHEGPYIVGFTGGALDLPLAGAHATQRRIDTVYVLLTDKNITADAAASAALQGGSIGYVTGATTAGALNFSGTPGAAGAPQVLPDGAVPLQDIPREPGVNVITTAVLVAGRDRRKSTSWLGAARTLFPGDTDTDIGQLVGEEVISPPTTNRPTLRKIWTGLGWRGAAPYQLVTTPAFASDTEVPNGGNLTIASLVVRDPGYPYQLEIQGKALTRFVENNAASNANFELVARINTNAGTKINLGLAARKYTGSTELEFPRVEGWARDTATYTGDTTVILRAEAASSTGMFIITSPAGAPYNQQLAVTVHPSVS